MRVKAAEHGLVSGLEAELNEQWEDEDETFSNQDQTVGADRNQNAMATKEMVRQLNPSCDSKQIYQLSRKRGSGDPTQLQNDQPIRNQQLNRLSKQKLLNIITTTHTISSTEAGGCWVRILLPE